MTKVSITTLLDAAYTFVSNLTRKGGTVLFVGTKKQAQEAVADAANRCGMPYGTLSPETS